MTVQQHPAGWWLPKGDTYFAQFLSGPTHKYKQNGFMREHLLEAFKYVRAWNVAVDVGAHVGFWSWDMAQKFEQVFAFEPVETNYECLVKNVADFPNVTTFNYAVGHVASACVVHNDSQRPGNTGSYYIQPDPYGPVGVVSLNQMRLPGCDLLKIDVEGFEYNVLRGASKVIKQFRPVVIMECSDAKFHDRYKIPEGEAQRWLLTRKYREVAAMRPDKVFVPIDS